MIAIVNVSPEGTDPMGVNEYELRINREVIARFTHRRSMPLHECLRRAADAAEAQHYEKILRVVTECQDGINGS